MLSLTNSQTVLLGGVLFARKYQIRPFSAYLSSTYHVLGTVLDISNETDEFPSPWDLAYIQVSNSIRGAKCSKHLVL